MSRIIAAVGFAIALAGCGEARRLSASADAASCGRCHVSAEGVGAAPSSGAHAAHVRVLGSRACEHCHPDPRVGSNAHMNGRVNVVFGELATHDDALSPRLDPDTLSCSAVYCHGAFVGGNESNAPAWTSVGEGAAACGTCHGLPPAATHGAVPADLRACAGCHATTVDAEGEVIAGGDHLNGRIDASQDRCTSCHGTIGGAGARSSHLAGAEASSCPTCHQPSPDGHFRLPALDASCVACHDGDGEVLSGRTPPPLPGWNDTRAGDWHGARAGTGYGGTLEAPYARGQGPLACTACHDRHASANAFLFASTVNGTAIPAATIDRAGVGAETLCSACHAGERHAGCISCHDADPEPPGAPCFSCHGHEGIRNWPPPAGGHYFGSCDHCHGGWAPTPEYAAPAITQGPAASGVTATSATMRWWTGEKATSYVEYGVGTAASIAGDDALVNAHVVTVTGLRPSTTYVWRARSSDQFRNVTESPLQTFTTCGPDDVPRPDLATVSAGTVTPNTTVVATLLWYGVTAPSSTAIEYEVQLASDPTFTFLQDADLGRTDATLATGNSGWIPGAPTQDSSWPPRPALGFDVMLTNLPQDDCMSPPDPNVYYFRVRARDQTGKVSEWSTPGSFTAMAWDEWC
jgi:predicted CxxxxCH...CXXCH cytochrome family protein